jgi:hypothetical protein
MLYIERQARTAFFLFAKDMFSTWTALRSHSEVTSVYCQCVVIASITITLCLSAWLPAAPWSNLVKQVQVLESEVADLEKELRCAQSWRLRSATTALLDTELGCDHSI